MSAPQANRAEKPAPAPAAPPPIAPRRADLDWIRVGAFGLLILFHIGLMFSSWTWHINVPHPEFLMPALLTAMNPWRLMLLFFVSGCAVALMRVSGDASSLIAERSRRLLPALLLGVVFLVPPQAYVEAVRKAGFAGSYLDYLPGYFFPLHVLPTNHLWFLIYAWLYALGVALLVAFGPRLLSALRGALERGLSGYRLIWIPILYCVALRLFAFPVFGATNNAADDWYNHALYFGAFLFGFLTVRSPSIWADFEKHRWLALKLAILGYVLGIVFWFWTVEARRVAYAIEQWAAIAAILGFGSLHLRNANTPLLKYLVKAVFPFYVLHQTVIVVAGHLLMPLDLPNLVFLPLMIAVTLGACWAFYELVRRSATLSAVFGLPKPLTRAQKLAARGAA